MCFGVLKFRPHLHGRTDNVIHVGLHASSMRLVKRIRLRGSHRTVSNRLMKENF